MDLATFNDYISIPAAVITIISSGVSVYLWLLGKKNKLTEEHNKALITAQLEATVTALKGASTNIQLMIRRCDDDGVTKKELQNLARMSRTDVFTATQHASDTDATLKDWHFGEMLHTYMGPESAKSTSAEKIR